MTGKKIMITGGAGFVGSHLTEKLLADGCDVHIFDYIPLEKANNLREVRNHKNLRYFQGDLRNKEDIEQFYVSDADVIYHLASVVGIKDYIADPLKLVDIVVIGTRHLLEEAGKNNTRFIFSSTSEIFGKNPDVPWDETGDRVLGSTSIDRWSYSSSKAVCEHMIYGMNKNCGLPFTIVRFFNVYGPRQNPHFVMSQSIYRAMRGEKPLLYDDGSMTRCFTYIDDIIDGLISVAEDPNAVNQDFNLGNSIEVTMKEVVTAVLRITGSTQGYKVFDTKERYGGKYEDIARRIPNPQKAQKILGWKAVTQIEEGISRTCNWVGCNRWWLE